MVDVVPDSAGEFEIAFTVPLDAVIPSTNTVTATVVQKPASSTATHSVPTASISVAPTEGPPGSSVTVTATNFDAFAPVSSITLGNVQVLPSPGPNTDADGAFSGDIQVPGLPTGNQLIVAKVRGITAGATFKITASLIPATPTPTPTPTPGLVVEPTTGLAPLLNADNLVRVWSFNNSTKAWTFFDPRPAANTIIGMTAAEVYWINVFSDQTVTLNSQQRVLTAGWNLLSW